MASTFGADFIGDVFGAIKSEAKSSFGLFAEIAETEDGKEAARDNKRIVFAVRRCDDGTGSTRVKLDAEEEGNFLLTPEGRRRIIRAALSSSAMEIVFLACHYEKLLHQKSGELSRSRPEKLAAVAKTRFNFGVINTGE